MAIVSVAHTRRFSFRSVHRLTAIDRPEPLHGHRFLLEVALREVWQPEQMAWVIDSLVRKLDGQSLNAILPASPTGENLVEWIDASLRSSPLAAHVMGVALQETRKNRFVSARSESRWIT